jgi:hypothetical protein
LTNITEVEFPYFSIGTIDAIECRSYQYFMEKYYGIAHFNGRKGFRI